MPKLGYNNYDKRPINAISTSELSAWRGWKEIGAVLNGAIANQFSQQKHQTIVAVECYPGVDDQSIDQLKQVIQHNEFIDTKRFIKPPAEIEKTLAPWLGNNDPVFGILCPLGIEDFFDSSKFNETAQKLARKEKTILIAGVGASLLTEADIVIYADMPRWELQNRFRRNEVSNLGADNASERWALQYKRGFFVDWRVADRHKRKLFNRVDFFLDTTQPRDPRLATGTAIRGGLKQLTQRPFRLVPFFDPAPWGGQWMREVCDLPGDSPNYGWCFDCVPEENSILMEINGIELEIPAINLVFYQPSGLLGDPVHARFGDEFPIRFDMLDTVDGGSLSFQVHPLTEYIQQTFGLHYTQDESYYLLDAEPKGNVYLGTREDIDPRKMLSSLETAQADSNQPFPVKQFVNCWPAKKHDHFLIPAGTVHCSGAGCMVLEISATPYIFTFKLWDWGRLGLDGRPRPIHLNHGKQVIQWERTTGWVERNLVNQIEEIGRGEYWREERTGLHEREFIETRRHWFWGPTPHRTDAISHCESSISPFESSVPPPSRHSVNVLNLVEGEAAMVESPTDAFEPFEVHYAETFIVPASVGEYTLRPLSKATIDKPMATIKAFVRR